MRPHRGGGAELAYVMRTARITSRTNYEQSADEEERDRKQKAESRKQKAESSRKASREQSQLRLRYCPG